MKKLDNTNTTNTYESDYMLPSLRRTELYVQKMCCALNEHSSYLIQIWLN